MQKVKSLLLFLAVALFLNLSACGGESGGGTDPAPTPVGANIRVIEITSDVITPTTWSNGRSEGYDTTVYVIRKYDFYIDDVTLTIEPGVIIKFHPTQGPYMLMWGNGKVIAQGTNTDPIIFTSFYDDTHGGDTNGDGSSSFPSSGDWYQVGTNGTQDSIFRFCNFYYGGNGSYLSTLQLYDSRATVDNCVFAHNIGGKDGGFYYGALDAGQARTGTEITNNRFYDNVIPLSIGYNYNIDSSNIFENFDGTITNDMNGIFINSSNNITRNISWTEDEVAFVIDDGDLWINMGYVLSLGNNVILKFCHGSTLLLDNGASALNRGSNVEFTSFKDDARGGDTNGDGSSSSPADGDWEGIYDNTAPLGGPYYFSWASIHYRDSSNF